MHVLGIISLIIAALCFFGGLTQDYVTHQTAYFLCWLGFGLAGMGFLILSKLNDVLSHLNQQISLLKANKKNPAVSNLEELYKHGLLTKEEFEAKQKELLK